MTFAYGVTFLFVMILNLLVDILKRISYQVRIMCCIILCTVLMQSVHTFSNYLTYSNCCVSCGLECSTLLTNEPRHDLSNNVLCANSKCSDKPLNSAV